MTETDSSATSVEATPGDVRVFDVAEVGRVTATVSDPDDTGVVAYLLRGPRINGTLSIGIGDPLTIKDPNTFAYAFGVRDEHRPQRS